jgi:hypothetical protein
MNSEQSLNKPTGRLAVATAHAVACWHSLERHASKCQAGCAMSFDGAFTLGQCEIGAACAEEYQIASRRVREMQTTARLEAGDMGSTLPIGEVLDMVRGKTILEAGDMGSTLEEVRA